MPIEHQPPQPIRDLIIKFLQREASYQELEILESWLKESEENRKQFDEINDTFQATVSLGRFTTQKVDRAWEKFAVRQEQEGRKSARLHTLVSSHWLKIAASLLIMAVAGTLLPKYLSTRSHVDQNSALIQNNIGNKTKLILPDSSIVWLNANSSIKYDTDFGSLYRQVTLNGEAFFDVKKGEKEFIVSTDHLDIHVKGTKFNVNTLGQDGSEKTTLEEGHVVLQIKGISQIFSMKPGDQVLFNRDSKKATVKKVDPSHYSAWKEEKLTFESQPLGNIARMLENRYHVSIAMDSVIAYRENISMTIQEEPIEEVMELIRLSSSLQYRIDGKHIVIFE